MKSFIRSASSARASGTEREFLFDDLYLRSRGPPRGGKAPPEFVPARLCAAGSTPKKTINRSEESDIDHASGQCRLSGIMIGFVNDVTVKDARPCCCERKKLEALRAH